jgi:hypothetical protein
MIAHNVSTDLTFISPTSKFNRRYIAPAAEVNTGVYETHPVLIRDARAEREKFTLETSGFQLVDHVSKVPDFMQLKSDFTGAGQPDKTYDLEIQQLLYDLTGADKVVTFGIVVRQATPSGPNYQPPASDVHVDWTESRANMLAKKHADFPYSRFKCINLWRTFSPSPQDYPLAVCDGRTLDSTGSKANSMIPCDKIPDLDHLESAPSEPIVSEADLFTFDSKQKWYYFSNMNRDEILVFTLYDSAKYPKGRCPHVAFVNDAKGAKPRESVEIRSIVYFK